MSCTSCNHTFKENEGRYNHSDGSLCSECESNIDSIVIKKKNITHNFSIERYSEILLSPTEKIGKYIISGKLLLDYVQAVDQCIHLTQMSWGIPDIIIIQHALSKREKSLQKIFECINLPYTLSLNKPKSQKFLKLLDEWLQEIISHKIN